MKFLEDDWMINTKSTKVVLYWKKVKDKRKDRINVSYEGNMSWNMSMEGYLERKGCERKVE